MVALRMADTDNDGEISYKEFMIAVIRVNLKILMSDQTDMKMRKTFGKIDVDHNGTLDLEEMQNLVTEKEHLIMEQIFKEYDADGSGEIDFDEFKDMIRRIVKDFEKNMEVIFNALEEVMENK